VRHCEFICCRGCLAVCCSVCLTKYASRRQFALESRDTQHVRYGKFTCCSALQCVAVCSRRSTQVDANLLSRFGVETPNTCDMANSHVAVRCSVLQCVPGEVRKSTPVCARDSRDTQYVGHAAFMCCGVLQCVAVCSRRSPRVDTSLLS